MSESRTIIRIAPNTAIVTNSIRRDSQLVEKSLRASLFQSEVKEVIFIDQNVEPLSLSKEITEHPKLKRIQAQVPAVSQARNQAVFSPEIEWIVFCDDDGYMAENYLSLLKEKINHHPQCSIFAGSIRRTDNQEFYSKRHSIGGDLNRFVFSKLLMGSNFAVRKDTFEALKKFDERFGVGARWGSGEETDFAWKAYFSNVKMEYAPELIVYHVPPRRGQFLSEFKKAFRYGIGKGALVSKWFFEKRQPKVLIEFGEMWAVPALLMGVELLRFNFKQSAYHFASIFGRIFGFVAFPFVC